MSIFVFMKDHVLSLSSVLGLDTDNAVASSDSMMKVLR